MSTKKQTTKNIELTQKLIEYLLNAKSVPNFPDDVSFVPFSKEDKHFNKANEELLGVLMREEKPVAKAEEPENSTDAWKITPINF